MTLRPQQRAALLAAATVGVLLGTTGAVTPAASAERHGPPAFVGPAAPGRDFIGPTLLDRSRGQSALHSPTSTETLARKFK